MGISVFYYNRDMIVLCDSDDMFVLCDSDDMIVLCEM